MLHGEVDAALARFWADTRERHRFLQHDRERPILAPEEIFLRSEEFFGRAAEHATLSVRAPAGVRGDPHQSPLPQAGEGAGRTEFPPLPLAGEGGGEGRREPSNWARPLPDLAIERGAPEPLKKLQQHVGATPHRVLVVAESVGRRETLLELLRDSRIEPPTVATLADFEAGDAHYAITVAPLAEGFAWIEPAADGRPAIAIEFVTETELFATGATARRRRKQEQVSDVNALIKDLSELKIGDPVVHVNHGIGRYVGLKHIDRGDGEGGASAFLHLEYADKATLYVPVAQLHLIARYTGVSAEEAPLHRLGSGQWDKAKRRAAEQVRDTAAELLDL